MGISIYSKFELFSRGHYLGLLAVVEKNTCAVYKYILFYKSWHTNIQSVNIKMVVCHNPRLMEYS